MLTYRKQIMRNKILSMKFLVYTVQYASNRLINNAGDEMAHWQHTFCQFDSPRVRICHMYLLTA